jgi:hypothetical protein
VLLPSAILAAGAVALAPDKASAATLCAGTVPFMTAWCWAAMERDTFEEPPHAHGEARLLFIELAAPAVTGAPGIGYEDAVGPLTLSEWRPSRAYMDLDNGLAAYPAVRPHIIRMTTGVGKRFTVKVPRSMRQRAMPRPYVAAGPDTIRGPAATQ